MCIVELYQVRPDNGYFVLNNCFIHFNKIGVKQYTHTNNIKT